MKTLLTAPLALAAALGLATRAAAPAAPTPGFPDVPTPVVTTLTGAVTDAATGAPLMGAQVVIGGTTLGAMAASDGVYSIALPGSFDGTTVTVVAQMIGYATATKTVRVGSGMGAVDFALEAQAMSIEAITVESERAPLQDAAGRARNAAPSAPQMLMRKTEGVPAEGWRYAPPTDREGYAHIAENGFRSASAHPLSTFGIDVDRASYANVRRFLLREGRLPPADAVRIEELVNYFPYDYADPRGDTPFAVHTDVAVAPWAPEHRLLRVALRGRPLPAENRPPSNLVFLIDVSGSMRSADKLPLLKQAFRLLTAELRQEDRVAMVVYAGAAGVVLPPTTGDRKNEILEAIDRLEAGGSTAGGAGIRLAYDVARRFHVRGGNNRVILATDGDFNVGPSSDSEMVRLIEEKRAQGTFLTVLGFGTGNLQDAKMEQIADHGNGNFAYIDSESEARKVLVAEMGGTLHTIAKDVKIQVEFNPAVVRGYRLIGYENRLLAPEDFDDDRKDAGELGAGHTVTALYEVVPVGARSQVEIREPGALRYGVDRLEAQEEEERTPMTRELAFVKLRYKEPAGSASRLLEHPVANRAETAGRDLRFAASVAAFGMLLRDSEHAGRASWPMVAELARGALGDDPNGYRREFLRMVDVAATLADGERPLAGRE